MGRRGVVVEIAPKNQVIIMTANGEFIKVPFKKHVHVGQEIRYKEKERLNGWQLGLAASLFLVLLGTWPMFTSQLVQTSIIPAFIITLDINPSLELKVSDKQKVIAIEGLNRDGEEFAARLAIVGDDLRLALEKISSLAEREGYLRSGQNQVVVTIASDKERDASLKELRSRSTGEHGEVEKLVLDVFGANQLAQVRIWQVPASLQQEAKLAGITPSRYIAIQVPEQPVIPQRVETKLTMAEPIDPEEHVLDFEQPTPVRAVLPPVQWRKQAAVATRIPEIHNVGFSVVARAKGELTLYQ